MSMVTPIQVLGVLFLLFALSRVILRWRSHRLALSELVLWVFVFGGILTVVLVPSLSAWLARLLGIGRGADLVIYGSIVLLFYLVFRIYIQLENIEYKLTTLVREIALTQAQDSSVEPPDQVTPPTPR
jgi:hypothetical protein